MPTIQSKKYPEKTMQFVDSKTWNTMQEKGLANRYRVVDDDDLQETIIPTPEKIIEFSDTDIPETKDNVEEILSREDIKKLLDEKEIPYNTRAKTDTLQKLLNDNK